MSVTCHFCDITFKQKYNLVRHLNDNRCKTAEKMSLYDFHMKIDESKKELVKMMDDCKKNIINIPGDNHEININNLITNNILFNIQINPINKLSNPSDRTFPAPIPINN